jgi:hypothetical protein
MTENGEQALNLATGPEIFTVQTSPNVLMKYYFADRPAHTPALRAAECALDITITLKQPASEVWPVFRNFDVWMRRYGFIWESIPADNQDNFVYLGDGNSSSGDGSDGTKTKYVVRKVVPQQLIYFDSLPLPIVGKNGVWTGHNLMSMREEAGQSTISIFMEHTWYSETMSLEELRHEAKQAVLADNGGFAFWRDYFIPDLISLIEGSEAAGEASA